KRLRSGSSQPNLFRQNAADASGLGGDLFRAREAVSAVSRPKRLQRSQQGPRILAAIELALISFFDEVAAFKTGGRAPLFFRRKAEAALKTKGRSASAAPSNASQMLREQAGRGNARANDGLCAGAYERHAGAKRRRASARHAGANRGAHALCVRSHRV